MARIWIDDSELRTLERDMRGAPLRIQFKARSAMRRSAKIVDAAMVEDASGHRHLRSLQKAVSHELLAPLFAEIGLSPGGQGSLAHIIAYGSVNNAPVYDHHQALRRSQPLIDQLFGNAAEESVW